MTIWTVEVRGNYSEGGYMAGVFSAFALAGDYCRRRKAEVAKLESHFYIDEFEVDHLVVKEE